MFPTGISAMWNANSLVQDLNFGLFPFPINHYTTSAEYIYI